MKLHELGDAKPFTCQICGKQVRTEKSLRQHVDLVHTKIGKQFKCEQCGHEFKQNHNLRQVEKEGLQFETLFLRQICWILT